MPSYKFDTKISDKGTFSIHIEPDLYGQEVEITIVPKKIKKIEKQKVTEFVKKWAGFLKNTDTDRDKYEYLMRKQHDADSYLCEERESWDK